MKSSKHLLTREMNLTPLVDLWLVLLILMVVVIPMLRHDPLPPPSRPAPAAQATPGVRFDQLAVAISADGAVFVEQRRVAREELPDLLLALHVAGPHRPVLVKGDRRLRYEQVRQLMAEIYRAGFQRVSLLS